MPQLPTVAPARRSKARADDSVVFAVYAPFGTDPTLSTFPNSVQVPVASQPLVLALQKVAAEGVHVSALIDLYEDDSYLVEIPAGQPKAICITSTWKQDMSAPQALAGFLRRTRQRFPTSTLVLALEGHGGGFVPDIDFTRLTAKSISNWPAPGGQDGKVRWIQSEGQVRFEPEPGSPALPIDSPALPIDSPALPAARMPMSTWALGAALRSAIKSGVPRPAVIHFANCFNASVELLHTVAPYADYATGYANYDFFTAGVTYPKVFHTLRTTANPTRLQLAKWFALENFAFLKAKQNHPTLGATVALATMRTTVAPALDKLAIALTTALRPANPALRPAIRDRIQKAAVLAQHFDTDGDDKLQSPDQFADLGSFCVQLQAQFATGDPVNSAAAALQATIAGTFDYGDWDRPWMDETQIWDFRKTFLGLNILLPDPNLQGIWDWRSPYYLSGTVDPTKPPAQRHVIDFLADVGPQRPRWVEFIVEYHREVALVGFLPALNPFFPLFNARFRNTLPHPGDGNPDGGPAGGKPGSGGTAGGNPDIPGKPPTGQT